VYTWGQGGKRSIWIGSLKPSERLASVPGLPMGALGQGSLKAEESARHCATLASLSEGFRLPIQMLRLP
jgi:hypothetical protein